MHTRNEIIKRLKERFPNREFEIDLEFSHLSYNKLAMIELLIKEAKN